jgi:hypothetical protein
LAHSDHENGTVRFAVARPNGQNFFPQTRRTLEEKSVTTSPKMLLTDAIYSDKPLTPFQTEYFGARYRNRLHSEVLRLFTLENKRRGLTRADLAKRLGKRPEQVTRWLSAPGNWTLDTVSNLMLAMGYEPEVGSRCLADIQPQNRYHDLASPTILTFATSASAQSRDGGSTAMKIVVSDAG